MACFLDVSQVFEIILWLAAWDWVGTLEGRATTSTTASPFWATVQQPGKEGGTRSWFRCSEKACAHHPAYLVTFFGPLVSG